MKRSRFIFRPGLALLAAGPLAAAGGTGAPLQEPGPAPTAAADVAPLGHAVSRDGTRIAFERSGEGPVVVLVPGALQGRGDSARMASQLAARFTVVAYDRRGRGASGDTPPYAVAREVEDLEALIDAVGGRALLFGGSSGAVLALEAADRLGARVRGAALFEPPFVVDDSRPPIPDDFFTGLATLVADGRRGDAVAAFMTTAVGVPEELLDGMRRAPMWPGLERLAHTLPYDGALLAGLQAGRPLPRDRWRSVAAPVLVIDGEASPDFLRHAAAELAAVLPGAERRSLAGADHSAAFTAPERFVPLLAELEERAPAAPAPGAEREPGR